MPIVKVSNGERIKFPDSMSPEEIQSALEKRFPTEEKPPGDFDFVGSAKFGAHNLNNIMQGMGSVFYNVPENLIEAGQKALGKPINPIYQKGIPNNPEDPYTKGGEELAPWLLGGFGTKAGIMAINKLLPQNIPKLLSLIARSTSGGAAGGATLAAETGKPISEGAEQGAIGGAVLGPAAIGAKNLISLMAGTDKGKQLLANYALNRLRKGRESGAALSPEDTAKALQKYYTNQSGAPMGVDIGTLTGDPKLTQIYEASGMTPTSGTSGAQNILQRQLLDKQGSLLQSDLSQIQNADSTVKNLLNGLSSSAKNRVEVPKEIGKAVKESFNLMHEKSSSMFDPLKNSNIRLDKVSSGKELLPRYKDEAAGILSDEENLKNLFGNTLTNPKVKRVAEMARNILQGSAQKNGLTLSEAMQHSSDIKELARAAKNSDREASRTLGNFASNLDKDINDALIQGGHEEEAKMLKGARGFYKENVIPYYNDKTLNNLRANPENANSGQFGNLLTMNKNRSIFNHLGDNFKDKNYQDLVISDLLTGENADKEGKTLHTAKSYANKYQALDKEQKELIDNSRPSLSDYSELLSERNKNQSSPNKIISKIEKIEEKKLTPKVKEPVDFYHSIGQLVNLFKHPITSGIPSLGGIVAGKSASVLRDPALLKAATKNNPLEIEITRSKKDKAKNDYYR